MSVLSFLKKTFSFDYRSMALYRVLLGIIVMADVIYRWPDLVNFYTDIGLIPRSLFLNEMAMPWSFSIHLANGSSFFINVLFLIHLLIGLCLMLGLKTRWAIIGAYLMTVSVHNRNWLVNNGGDDVLRSILFFSMFLPLGNSFSLDAALKQDKKVEKDYFSIWGLALFLQVFVIYFVSYLLKDSPIWRSEYSAVFYSSRLDIFATKLGILLRDFPGIMKFNTIFSIYLEWLGPLVFIGSYLFGRFWWVSRLVLVILFCSFHLGIAATMKIGLFPYIAITMWILFLPGPFWDFLKERFRRRNFHKLQIFFDAECGFCQKGVRIFREFLLFEEVSVLAAQTNSSIHKDMEREHSWVLVNENGERFFKYAAWLELVKHSPVLFWAHGFFNLKLVRFIGQHIYHWISHHRPFMGKLTQFFEYHTQKKEITWLKWMRELVGAFFFVTLLVWNLTTIKKLHFKAPFFQTVGRWVHIYQEWNMFAPYPKMDNIWVEIPGELSDGTQIDVLTGNRDIYSVKDKEFVEQIKNEHWRKLFLNVSERSDYARYYGGYLCRWWNDRKLGYVKNVTLRKFEIIVFSQLNLADGDKGGITRKLSWRHWCFDEDYKKENPPKK